jgi:PTS system fructose-specific IIC component
MGTAVEEGIAITHARLAGLGKTLVVFGRSHEGIEWDSPDGKPSRLIFLILTDSADDNAQIQILRAVSRLGVDPAAREALAAVNPEKESWDILQSVLASKKVVKK